MIVVPQAFIGAKNIKKILIDGLNCIVSKEATAINPDEDRYVAAHALTLVLSGQLRVTPLDGNPQVVSKNQMIFLQKGLYLISDIIPQDQPFRAIVFFFEEDTIDEFLRSAEVREANAKKMPSGNVFNYSNEIQVFVDGLISLYGQVHHNHQITRFKLMELLGLISRSPDGQQLIAAITAMKNKPKGNVRSFMEQNFDRGLNIEDYAYLTGRSISTFHRDFKRQFGIAPKRWLISKRMAKAKSLLTTNNMSITQLALEIGYENVSHFIKAFNKEFGISPKQFQIKQREEAFL